MNMEIFRLINNLENKNTFWDNDMLFFSEYMPYVFAGIIALVFIMLIDYLFIIRLIYFIHM